MSKITELLERAWTKNAHKVHAEGYDLVILAVPRHPANIEAIAAIELDLVADLLEGFVKAREVSHGLRGAEKEIDAQFRADARIEGSDEREAGASSDQMGQGRDTGGLSTVNGNEAPAQGEDHTAVDAVELSGGKPCVPSCASWQTPALQATQTPCNCGNKLPLRMANRAMPRVDPEDERNFHALMSGDVVNVTKGEK